MDFGGLLQSISPLLGLIPGAGAIAAPVANMAGQFIQNKQTQANSTLPRQQNTNPYGFANGGLIDPPKKKKKEITYIGEMLPEFTVIAQHPTASNINPFTYKNLKTIQNEGNKPVYDIWKAAGSPNINISEFSNTQSYDPKSRSLEIGRNDGGVVENFLSEIPHAIQNTYYYPGTSLQAKYDSDLKNNNAITPQKIQDVYNIVGSLEHEAHKIIEPEVRKAYSNTLYNKRMFNKGGYLNSTGPNTQEVVGHNPSIKDGVELPHAIVDDGETISNTSQGKYVFSDRLTNPRTGRSFAQDDKKLAQSDSLAIKKPVDKEAQNTLKINQMARDTLAKLNDQVRMIAQVSKLKNGINGNNGSKSLMSDKLYEKAYGGKLSYADGGPTYMTGYQAPWNDFNIAEFQKYAGMPVDNIYGKQTNEALYGDMGKRYAAQSGYAYDPDTKGYLSLSGVSQPQQSNNIPNIDQFLSINGMADSNRSTNIFRDYSRMMDPMSNTSPEIGPRGLVQPIAQGTLANTIKTRTSPYVDPYAPMNLSKPTTVTDDKPYPGDNKNEFRDNLGNILQGVGFGAQALSLLKRPDKQTLYTNNAPINMQQYDPAQALNRSQYNFNALRSGISNSVGDANRMSNMQQAYSNKTRNEADILNHYNEMNKQSQVNYEQRLGQRQSENNQNRYNVDQINDQNLAARNNALRGMFANLAGLGGEINNQKSNKQNVKWLLEAYPDIAQFFQEQSKTKKN